MRRLDQQAAANQQTRSQVLRAIIDAARKVEG